MSYIYLASPYNSGTSRYTDPELKREDRYKAALYSTAWLMQQKFLVYSPIVHNHELAKQFKLPIDFKYWQGYNIAMLTPASHLYVLTIPGWTDSEGVQGEINYCRDLRKPINLLNVTYSSFHHDVTYQIVDYSIPA